MAVLKTSLLRLETWLTINEKAEKLGINTYDLIDRYVKMGITLESDKYLHVLCRLASEIEELKNKLLMGETITSKEIDDVERISVRLWKNIRTDL